MGQEHTHHLESIYGVIGIMVSVIVVKFCLYLYCRNSKSQAVQTYAQAGAVVTSHHHACSSLKIKAQSRRMTVSYTVSYWWVRDESTDELRRFA